MQLVINRNHGEELISQVDNIKEQSIYLKVVVDKLTRSFFYSYDGEGLRYEIQEFMSMIATHRKSSYKLRRRESIAIAEVIEKFNKKDNFNER